VLPLRAGLTSLRDFHRVVQVAIRVRPMNAAELARGDAEVVTVDAADARRLLVSLPGAHGLSTERAFAFHACLGPGAAQGDVIRQCGIHQLLDAALDGYNATILAVRSRRERAFRSSSCTRRLAPSAAGR
jgi:hypothetical protein